MENNFFLKEKAYCRVKQRGLGGARTAEEAVLWQQILICIHGLLRVLPADQAAIELCVCRARQVHPIITLNDAN